MRAAISILFCSLCLSGDWFTAYQACADEPLVWIKVDDRRRGFVTDNAEVFRPWGFNYDHNEQGQLIEDYWDQDWSAVEQDFAEMKELGANVVRIHLQFGKFMDDAQQANPHALEQLQRLVKLAERERLYLDLTGLGCYHKPDVPAWYDKLSETDRWDTQARFWEAIATACASSPAVFCYDLMNEPVVPGGGGRSDWLGPPFGDKHFVQFITLDLAGRNRPDVAKAWIHRLVQAIRAHDKRRLITVGLVPWSLDRPGLTSGFDPTKVAGELDFVCTHIYPQSAKLDEAMETLNGFQVGKPVVIEELFNLSCSIEELGRFLEQSRSAASGWIGFYWGTTLEEYRRPAQDFNTAIRHAMMANWLEYFQRETPRFRENSQNQRPDGDRTDQ